MRGPPPCMGAGRVLYVIGYAHNGMMSERERLMEERTCHPMDVQVRGTGSDLTTATMRSDADTQMVRTELASGQVETEIVNDYATIRVPVMTEQLVVEKEVVSRGAVHLHKGVETAEQTLQVPVFHEEATIEHMTPEAYNSSGVQDPDTMVIPIYEEQLVVEKRMVLKEYIRIRKRWVEEQHTVTEALRREYLTVTDPPAPTTAG